MRGRAWYWLLFGLVFFGAALVAAYELIASPMQAMFLSDYAKRLNYHDVPGPSPRISFPEYGPYDERFGYTRIPAFEQRLKRKGFEIVRQAEISPEMADLARFGLFLPYREKSVGGLTLDDCAGHAFYSFREPRFTYRDFAAIPPIVANTLLFIENRELLDPNHPLRNPAVEWDRLAEAVLEKVVQTVQPGRHVPGGSTLATQIEKYRHSPDGLTMTAGDKLRQMASASLRAYLDGPDTLVTRRRIVLDYLNTVPLSAAPGFGEVNGIGDGLYAWFGLDFDQVNHLLAHPEPTAAAARAYKHVLGLLISQRKPSMYLVGNRSHLDAVVNTHLAMLAKAGVITPAFRDMAMKEHIRFRSEREPFPETEFTRQKAAAATRTALLGLLGVERLYDLDRLDLTVRTSLHAPTQQAVSKFLAGLNNADTDQAYGMYGRHLLVPGNDLNKIIYSFTLYQRTPDGPALRVQADNLNQPFDINQGAKLGMGSSAKLRTLITYLEVIAEMRDRYGRLDPKALAKVKLGQRDTLGQWALNYLRSTPDRDLATMLRAAMARTYSGNPGEVFYTGGGLHRFANFVHSEDNKVWTVHDAFVNSVNLPFVRLMRDIVHHYMYQDPNGTWRILDDPDDARRSYYLARFADQEGTVYLIEFHKKYRGMAPAEIQALFYKRLAASPGRLAAALRYVEPEDDLATFTARMKDYLNRPASVGDKQFAALYERYGPGKFSLADQAFVARVHPLELWLVGYLSHHPGAHWDEVYNASIQARQDSYAWLYKTSNQHAQDIRIQSMLEQEAYREIYRHWKRLDYPFSSIVPSYATAIGASADRPAALAELMGILLNNGVRQTPALIRRLDFGADTPYHTVFARDPAVATPLLPSPLTQVVREALVGVVQDGTAVRVKGAFGGQDGPLAVGGKTGTGDNRFETFSSSGTVLQSRAVNRVATFVFFIGRHFYGTITAFVPGEAAADYQFSSALPVQVLKHMAPILDPLVRAGEAQSLGWNEEVAEFEAANPPPPPPEAAPTTTKPATATAPAAAPGKPASGGLDFELKPTQPESPNPVPGTPARKAVPLKPDERLPGVEPPAQPAAPERREQPQAPSQAPTTAPEAPNLPPPTEPEPGFNPID